MFFPEEDLISFINCLSSSYEFIWPWISVQAEQLDVADREQV